MIKNSNRSLDIIQEFSLFLKLEISNETKCNFEVTPININLNNHLTNKLSSLADVFKSDNKADIFESRFKTKTEISKNATKRGVVKLLLDDKALKYYCVLAGGFIYLFESSENELPSFTIPLKNLEAEKIINESNNIMKLANNKNVKDESHFLYLISFDKVEVLDSWITAIKERKTSIKMFSEKINLIGKPTAHLLIYN